MYDFDRILCRRGLGSEKWEVLEASPVTDPLVVPLSIADMEFAAPPAVIAAIHRAADLGTFGYTMGTQACKEATCRWMARRNGWQPKPEWLVHTFGVIHSILMAAYAVTQPGDGVICQTPGYPPFRDRVTDSGRIVRENPLVLGPNGYEMDFDHLETLCKEPTTTMMLLCSPHNPVGRVWHKEELERVAALCAANGVTLFSDEIHCDFTYAPRKFHSAASLTQVDTTRLIIATSTSKTFNLAGLTTASIFIPHPPLRKQFFAQSFSHTGEFNSYFGLAATQAAYEEGESWLDELLVYVQGNYQFCKDYLKEHLPAVVVHPMEGTYLLWADFNALGYTPQELEARMLANHLFLDEGPMFGTGGHGFERINLACSRVALADAMKRMVTAMA